MTLLRHVPNALTCCNLLCGCLGLLCVFEHPIEWAAYFVWAACAFDFLDGFAARSLKVSSPIGKQLDSLADMVSFGVLPSIAMYVMIAATGSYTLLPFISLSLAVFSALRLAKFNIDENQNDAFIGLPTPASALFITALPFVPGPLQSILGHSSALIAIILLFSYFLVSPFGLFALKFKNFSWTDNRIRFTFLLLAVLLLSWWQAGAIPLIILLYIVISLVSRFLGIL
jgi:CDP-diacylglycerol--serine O-phosphatidyltransferase